MSYLLLQGVFVCSVPSFPPSSAVLPQGECCTRMRRMSYVNASGMDLIIEDLNLSYGHWLFSYRKIPTSDELNIYGISMEHLWWYLLDIYDIMTGWWYTYCSETYESQLGLLFPIYGTKTCSKPPNSICNCKSTILETPSCRTTFIYWTDW